MRRKTATMVIGALLASIVFMLLTVNPAVATYYFPVGKSDITVYNDTSGSILSYIPGDGDPYDISYLENVIVRYNGTWDDQRSTPELDGAIHEFNVSAVYNSITYSEYYSITTWGSTSGYYILNITIPAVRTPVYIPITYNATLTVTTFYTTHEEMHEYYFV